MSSVLSHRYLSHEFADALDKGLCNFGPSRAVNGYAGHSIKLETQPTSSYASSIKGHRRENICVDTGTPSD